jgi:hypothetical protein
MVKSRWQRRDRRWLEQKDGVAGDGVVCIEYSSTRAILSQAGGGGGLGLLLEKIIHDAVPGQGILAGGDGGMPARRCSPLALAPAAVLGWPAGVVEQLRRRLGPGVYRKENEVW